MRPRYVVLAGLVLPATAIEFVNPPPFTEAERDKPELNPVFEELSTLNIAWTRPENGAPVSLRITPLNRSAEAVWIVEDSLSQRHTWTVFTSTNLSIQNQFFFSLVEQNATSAGAFSRIFNITRKETDDQEARPTTTGVSDPAQTTSGSTTNESEPATVPVVEPMAEGFSRTAQIALGVSIPCAVLLGLLAGWFFFGRRRKPLDGSGEPMLGAHGGQPNEQAAGEWASPSNMTMVPHYHGATPLPPPHSDLSKQYPMQPVEVSAQGNVHELPSQSQR